MPGSVSLLRRLAAISTSQHNLTPHSKYRVGGDKISAL